MSRAGSGSISNYLSSSTTPVTNVPLTLACWFNSTSITASQVLVAVDTGGGTANAFYLQAAGGTAGDPIEAGSYDGAYRVASSATGYSANTWTHAAAVFASTTSRTAFINGVGGTANTVSSNPTVTGISLGVLRHTSTLNPLNGKIADAAIWNVALTDAEIASLADGVSPLLIRPGNLVAYWPLYGANSPEPDFMGGYPLTITGTMAADIQPGNLRGRGGVRFAQAQAAGGGTSLSTGIGYVNFTGSLPTLAIGATLALGAGLITFTGSAPTLSTGSQQTLSTGIGRINYTGAQPTIVATGGAQSVSTGIGNIDFTGTQPTIAVRVNLSVYPALYLITGYQPTLETVAEWGWSQVSSASSTWVEVSDASSLWTEIPKETASSGV